MRSIQRLTLLALLTTVFFAGCNNNEEAAIGEACDQDSDCAGDAICAASDDQVEPTCQLQNEGDAGMDTSDDASPDDAESDTSTDVAEDTTDDTAEDTGQDVAEDTTEDTSEDTTDDTVDDAGDAGDTTTDDTADAGPDCETTSSPECAAHWLFITSTKFNGNLGGASGADQKCQNAASNAGLSRSGWVAVIADGSDGVRDRITLDGEVYLTDGTRFATNSDAFFLSPEAKPTVDENGQTVTESANRFWGAWTGVDNESAGTDQCIASGGTTPWTSQSDTVEGNFGFPDVAGNKAWLQNGSPRSCDTMHRLYCISDQP